MRKLWSKDDVLNIKLRDDLFTLAQMPVSPYLMFFDIANKNGAWKNVDLNNVPVLFCVCVATARVKQLVAEKVAPPRVVPSRKPMPRLMIKAGLNFAGGYPFRGGNLIEIDERGETTGRPIIKRHLSAETDADIIRQYELTNMWVVPEKLRERLILYFDTGVNWDPHKEQVFPGISPPLPRKTGSAD